jgi:hypothetical protein
MTCQSDAQRYASEIERRRHLHHKKPSSPPPTRRWNEQHSLSLTGTLLPTSREARLESAMRTKADFGRPFCICALTP